MNDNQQVFLVPDEMREHFIPVIPETVATEDPTLFAAVETEKNEMTGILALVQYEEAWEILYIEVCEQFRRMGIGAALIETVISCASGMFITELSCSLTLPNVPDEEREGALAFFLAQGFRKGLSTEIRIASFAKARISLLGKEKETKTFAIRPLRECSVGLWGSLLSYLRDEGSDLAKEDDASDETPDSPIFLVPDAPWTYDSDFSCLCVEEKNHPVGCLLARRRGKNDVELDYMWSIVKGPNGALITSGMLRFFLKTVGELYDGQATIYANTQNENSKKLMAALSGGEDEKYADALELVRSVF